jgi:sn-glycerol 3-phosphate transport system substrate-binding protein
VFELMRDEQEAFSPDAYLPAVTGYYADVAGNMLSFPFNASTPILYYNKDKFRAAGLDPEIAPKTWADVGAAAKGLRAAGAVCGFTTSWPSWINVENFSAFHNLPISTKANGFDGLDAVLTFNNPVMVRHIAQLAEWQTTKVFDYSGRATTAEPRFQNGECGIFIGSSATRADIEANSKFEVGYGMLPYWPDVAGAPQNTIIGGATLWVLRNRPRAEYKGVAKFFGFLSKPEIQAAWHQNTGYLPITRDLDRADHTETADREFEGASARIVRSDPRCDRRRAGTGHQRQEIRAGCAGFRRRARQPAAASVRAGESGPVETVVAAPRCLRINNEDFCQ